MQDIDDLKARVDLAALVALDLGQPHKRAGRWLFWPCPFHQDRDPSLGVTSDTGRYKCFGCGATGDHLDFLTRRRNLTTREAIEELRRLAGLPETQQAPAPVAGASASTADEEPPADKWQQASRALVTWAAGQLWTDAGAPGRAYLLGGGLTEDTIRAWGLGWNPAELRGPAARWGLDGPPVTLPRGVVIPGEVAGALWYVKVRRFEGDTAAAKGKYPQVRGGRPALFGADRLRADGRPLLLCEGERDTLLAWQELGEMVDAATLGSASGRHAGRWLLWLLPYKRLLVAFDTDAAGQDGAAWWAGLSRRAVPVRLPHSKDLTEFHQAGGDLRAWLRVILGQQQAPTLDPEKARKLAEARQWAAEAEAAGVPTDGVGYPSWAAWLADVEAELGASGVPSG